VNEASAMHQAGRPIDAEYARDVAKAAAEQAVQNAVNAQDRAPQGPEGYRTEYQIRMRSARRIENRPPPSHGLVLGGLYTAWAWQRRAENDAATLPRRRRLEPGAPS